MAALTRRDVARGLLSVPSAVALTVLPSLRRQLFAAGNPLSAAFWESAQTAIGSIAAGTATIGDVREWLESTGTEPTTLIDMHVWAEEAERSPLQTEMHGLLVTYLEDRLAAGEIGPDRLAAGDATARRAYVALQERWMTSPLPDGRVPMDVLLDEQDEKFLAEWDEAEAEALDELRAVLESVGERPLPRHELHKVCMLIRSALASPGWPGDLLTACGGVDPQDLPADDSELWLTLAAGVVSPVGDLPDMGALADTDDVALDEDSQAIVALCSIQHYDWLAAISALARGGPGTPAAEDDLAGYVTEYETDNDDGTTGDANLGGAAGESDDGDFGDGDSAGLDDVGLPDFAEDFDEFETRQAAAGLFIHVTALWQVLGAIDDDERLTPLGWWGLPEALQRAWAPGT